MSEELLEEVPQEPIEGEVEIKEEAHDDEIHEDDSEEVKQTKSQNAKQRLRRKLREEQEFNRKILEENQSLVVRLDTLEGKLKGVIDPPPPRPNRVDFNTEEEYEDSLFAWRDAKKAYDATPEKKSEKPAEKSKEIPPTWKKQIDLGEDKYDDFKEVITNPKLNISDPMALTIAESDNGAEIAYFLGKNPKEADRIASLSFAAQVKEIMKLEQKFQKQTTSAPEPITPIKGAERGIKDVSKMTPDEYREFRLKQMAAKNQ
jgi:hypothetical protein